jgi:hypothetical protein
VDARAAMLVEGRRGARYCGAFEENAGANGRELLEHALLTTPPGPIDHGFVRGKTGGKLLMERRKMAFTSSGASICGRRDCPIRKKIIGHGMPVFPKCFRGRNVLLRLLRAFPLLHQPARQHGRGVLFHPKIEKRGNFFTEIGGVAETREFVALQRIARSGEKKLPRRLSFAMVHASLLVPGATHIKSALLTVNSTNGAIGCGNV